MIHISYSEGCYPGVGCSYDDEDEGANVQAQRGKRADSTALASLVSCRAGVHPYDPGATTSDVAGCVSAGVDRAVGGTRLSVNNLRASLSTSRASYA